MQCLTSAECVEITAGLGVELLQGGGAKFLQKRGLATAQLSIPETSGHQSVLMNTLFAAFGDDRKSLIWVREWGVFPSDEYPELWQTVRERYGDLRPLSEAPGHLFAADEVKLARGMARLILLFGWDAFVTCAPLGVVTYISHDGLIFFYARDRSDLGLLDDLLQLKGVNLAWLCD